MDNGRQLWRNRWLNCINELTSTELQRKSWLDEITKNPHWSFTEFMCSYFDDLSISNNYEYQIENGLISNEEYAIIREWHHSLDEYKVPKYEDSHSRRAILEDKEWLAVIDLGVKAKNKLQEILSKEESLILKASINHLEFE